MILFMLISLAPGDVLGEFSLNPSITPEVREAIKKSLGLDQPIHIRYVKWAVAFVKGDWGYSFATRQPVNQIIFNRLPTTLVVVGVAFVIGVLIAIPLGVYTALNQDSISDRIITILSFLGYCLPGFFTAILFILIFSIKLGWLPFIYDNSIKVTGWDTFILQVKQSIMPISILAAYEIAYLTRFVRSATLDTLNEDYVRTAHAKGLLDLTIINRHILRNSLIPVITLIALRIPAIFTGAIITEQIFVIPGIGNQLVKSIETNDVPVVVAIVFIYAILVVLFNLIADLLYGVLDPRVSYE